MKCPYCAEQIQDQALLCRFCGARRSGTAWSPPEDATARVKRNLTIVTSGWLLLLSGAWSLLTVTSPVHLFGATRAGLIAVIYNGLFGGLLAAMGYALVARKQWALSATWASSLMYTIDKLELVLDPSAREAALGESAAMLGELAATVQQVVVLSAVLFLLGWWGFVAYLYWRRDYFRAHG